MYNVRITSYVFVIIIRCFTKFSNFFILKSKYTTEKCVKCTALHFEINYFYSFFFFAVFVLISQFTYFNSQINLHSKHMQ